MTTHTLKTDKDMFQAVWAGEKTFEIRKNDRDFQVYDNLRLRETEHSGAEMANGAPLVYTGRSLELDVTHMISGPIYGLADGWVVMSIAMP